MAAPDAILRLAEQFHLNRQQYRQPTYNETQTRREFIDPFFKALGWDVDNSALQPLQYREVVHEATTQIDGRTKNPDYQFQLGGKPLFFVEAKKPSVNLRQDIKPAFQLRRYGWSARLPLNILTDFEEFVVYDCRVEPNEADLADTARALYITYQEYESRWPEIEERFSREAVHNGALDEYLASLKVQKGTIPVDAAFLKTIESWREMLAREIARLNPTLSQRNLNYAVQMTIDRLIFLRICEDRDIEPEGRLKDLATAPNLYPHLCDLFRDADDRYNSGLFHFGKKRGDTAPDELTLTLEIGDAPLKKIIDSTYYPSPYVFRVIPVEILGQVYEQFLGKVITLASDRSVTVEEKPEVRKAGGVYYTPAYIVNYIVQNTLGPLLEGKTPEEAASLKVLDPACGSGSFLLGAYQYLLDWHLNWYTQDGPEKYMRVRRNKAYPPLYQRQDGTYGLTTNERKRILLNNLYGVDIDPQAVEVTKLSLLLKVLEGETAQALSYQLSFLRERALPDLDHNIKCGNSLIGFDFYQQQQMTMFDEAEQYRINAFDWQAEFPQIFQVGGFDAVIGNPPYVRQEILGTAFKEYAKNHYKTFNSIADLYVYFIEQGINVLRTEGIFSIIVANKWMRANYGEPLRRWLKQQCIEEITDFGDLPVFQNATTYPCIIRISKNETRNSFYVTQVKTLNFISLNNYVQENRYFVNQKNLRNDGWSLADNDSELLLTKLQAVSVPLNRYVQKQIYYGIKTGLNEAFIIDGLIRNKLIEEDANCLPLIKPFFAGKDVKRYFSPKVDRYLVLLPNGWTRINSGNANNGWEWLKESYPSIAKHLAQFAEPAKKRYDQGEYWWELRACEYYDKFDKPKIIVPCIVQNASYCLDKEGIYSNDKTSIIAGEDLYLLGLLNSKTLDFVMHKISSTKQGGYFEYKPMYIEQLPIRTINFVDPADKKRHDDMVQLVERMLELHRQLAVARTAQDKTMLQRQIEATDRQIDRLVYELYDLTEAEIKIVEGQA